MIPCSPITPRHTSLITFQKWKGRQKTNLCIPKNANVIVNFSLETILFTWKSSSHSGWLWCSVARTQVFRKTRITMSQNIHWDLQIFRAFLRMVRFHLKWHFLIFESQLINKKPTFQNFSSVSARQSGEYVSSASCSPLWWL